MGEASIEKIIGPYEHTQALAQALAEDLLSRYELDTGIAHPTPGVAYDPNMGNLVGLFRSRNGPKTKQELIKLFEEAVESIEARSALDSLYNFYINKQEEHPTQIGTAKALISKYIEGKYK